MSSVGMGLADHSYAKLNREPLAVEMQTEKTAAPLWYSITNGKDKWIHPIQFIIHAQLHNANAVGVALHFKVLGAPMFA
ncbi:hypothetical protein OUZ56_032937 [Daphnia magna]|uniref:Uncharacterized protein n=1 Tax=Daphnia magna TaxID=35525 RepID=A0ABQ9ZX86_9CRUS|nr:hypothetical protein OUZ56_032937 [Daphnia magna]